MPSSSRPYQSRLLRLVLSQFRQGMARQQKLWQRTKSAVLWGVQATLYPVYVLLRTVKTTGQQIGSAPRHLLNRFRPSASEGQSSPATTDVSGKAPHNENIATANASAAKALNIPADRPIIQALTLARQWQLPPKAGPLVKRFRGWLRRDTSGALALCGLASDIESRGLQLIGPHNQIAIALTPIQAQHLHDYIQHLLAAYWQQSTATQDLPGVSRSDALPSTVPAPSLPHPPFWARWRLSGLAATAVLPSTVQGSSTGKLTAPLPSKAAPAPISANTPKAANASKASARSTELPYNRVATLPESFTWEARVLDSAYMPHPLEQLLRWVDRLLSWIEQHCTTLIRWIRNRFYSLRHLRQDPE